jgi:hypothetical protein
MVPLSEFVNQFRADLSIECPPWSEPACSVCVIHNAGSDDPCSCDLNKCQYYFEGEVTDEAKRRDEWIRDVLREAYRHDGAQGYLRWARRLGWETNGEVALDRLYSRGIYTQYSISDFRSLVALIREIDAELLQFNRQHFRITPEEGAVLDESPALTISG